MKKKRWKKIIPWVLLLAVVAALIILPMVVGKKDEEDNFEYVSAQAELRDISSSLSGGGPVNAHDKEDVTVPDGVEITRFLVNNGEDVEAGQPVAEVDGLTVLAAIAKVQQSMDSLEKDINEVIKSGSTAIIKGVADGRVKAVYAKSGDDVRSVMIEHGSLGIVSMDGLMSAEIACDTELLTGDPVTVKCSNGKEYPGRVSLSLNGILTVTVTDNGPEIDDIAEVYDSAGNLLGSGILKVNSPWKIVYADGTVNVVSIKAGQKVQKGMILVRLKDTGSTEMENYSRKHREYEDLLQDLLKMLQSGNLTAPCDGFVSGLDKSIATGLGAGTEHCLTRLAEMNPTDLLSLVLITSIDGDTYTGKIITLTIMDLIGIGITDFSDIETIKATILANFAMTFQDRLLSATDSTINSEIVGGEAQVGDVFLLISSTNSVIKLTQIVVPTTPYYPSIGGFGGYSASEEEETDLFPLEGSVVLSVTPDEEMSITISVDELDILRYSVGMPADIFIDALPGESFTGTVTKIAAVGTNSGGSSKFEVTVSLPYNARILPGMNTSVVIHTGSTGMVVTIPAAALQDSGSKSFVYTGYDEKNKVLTDPVTVEIGASDGDYVQIVSGLDVGQSVWYANYLTELNS